MDNSVIIALVLIVAVYLLLRFWPRPDATCITNFSNGAPDQMIRIRTSEGVEILETFYLFAGHELTLIAVGKDEAVHWEIKQDAT